MAMSDEQFDRYVERNYQKNLEQKKCLGENILDDSNTSVKSVEVTELRSLTLLERFLIDNFSDYQIKFNFILDKKIVPVSCYLWTQGVKSLKNDLAWFCQSHGKKLDLSLYIRHASVGDDWFVVSRGCLRN